jgi:hypothetical protein
VERFEPIFWDLEVVGFIILALLGLMMAASVIKMLKRQEQGAPVANEPRRAGPLDHKAAADQLRDLIARTYRPDQTQSRND